MAKRKLKTGIHIKKGTGAYQETDVSSRKWRNLIVALLIISLIPIIVISFYNHSSADDYSYGIITRHAWMQAHSIIDLFKGVGRQVSKSYMTWQGTYAAVAVFSLQPGVFSDKLYFLTTFILVGMLVLCTFYFFRTVLGQVGANRDIADITAGVVSILSIQTLPHAIQSFFWWNGSTFYTLFYSLMLLQIATMVRLFADKQGFNANCMYEAAAQQGGMSGKASSGQALSGKASSGKATQGEAIQSNEIQGKASSGHHVIRWICCILLGFIISGGNYIAALVNIEITVLYFVLCIVRRRNIIGSFILTVVTGAGFAISVTAPGNAVRMATETQISPIQTILQSFQYGFQYVHEYLTLYLIIAMVFLLPFLWKLCNISGSRKNSSGIRKNSSGSSGSDDSGSSSYRPHKLEWLFMLIVMFCLFSSSFAPTVFTSEQEGPRRVQNIRYFMFIVMSILMETGAIYVVKYILSGVKDKSSMVPENEIDENIDENVLDLWHGISGKDKLTPEMGFTFRKYRRSFFTAILICLLIVVANDIIPKDRRDNLTSVSTARSLLIGEAQGFDKTADERMEIYLSDEKDITLPQYTDHPKALYYPDFDVTGDVTDWKNVAAARFYDKDSVGLE